MPCSLTVISSSAEATARIGSHLASLLRSGDVLTLDGDLGAGKTALARGIAQALGHGDEVMSPTFTIVMEHPARSKEQMPMFHFDVYRLSDGDDFLDAGLDEYFSRHGISVVEWGEIVADVLPSNRLRITILGSGDERTVRLEVPENREKDISELTRLLEADSEIRIINGGALC